MANPEQSTWYINTDDYLGFAYDEYRTKLQGLALSQPQRYVELRNAVISKVRDKLVKKWFDAIFKIMTRGTITDEKRNVSLIHPFFEEESALGPPSYPAQQVSVLSLRASKTLNVIISDLVDKLIGVEFDSLALKKMKDKSKVAGVEA